MNDAVGDDAYRVVLVKRDPAKDARLLETGWSRADSTLVAAAGFVINPARGRELDYLLVQVDGRVVDVAAVLDADRVPARYGGNPSRCHLVVRLAVPAWVEAVIGADVSWNNTRTPVRYATLIRTGDTVHVQP